MLTKEQWNLRLGMYKSGMVDFDDIYSTIAEHCGEASNNSKPHVSLSLRDDIVRTVELYTEKMNQQAEVGGYSSALLYQTKISALEDVLIKIDQSNAS